MLKGALVLIWELDMNLELTLVSKDIQIFPKRYCGSLWENWQ